jgi:hypothetical protein
LSIVVCFFPTMTGSLGEGLLVSVREDPIADCLTYIAYTFWGGS